MSRGNTVIIIRVGIMRCFLFVYFYKQAKDIGTRITNYRLRRIEFGKRVNNKYTKLRFSKHKNKV